MLPVPQATDRGRSAISEVLITIISIHPLLPLDLTDMKNSQA